MNMKAQAATDLLYDVESNVLSMQVESGIQTVDELMFHITVAYTMLLYSTRMMVTMFSHKPIQYVRFFH
jgi:hypothetical protein